MLKDKNYQIADNLSQVAQDLINYILKSHTTFNEQNKHIAELTLIMKEVEDESHKPLLVWWSVLYRLHRQHAHERISSQPILVGQLLILDVIASFLEKWSHDPSAVNLILLDILLLKLNKYEEVERDARLAHIQASARETIVLSVKFLLLNIFIQSAKKTLSSHTIQITPQVNIVNFLTVQKKRLSR